MLMTVFCGGYCRAVQLIVSAGHHQGLYSERLRLEYCIPKIETYSVKKSDRQYRMGNIVRSEETGEFDILDLKCHLFSQSQRGAFISRWTMVCVLFFFAKFSTMLIPLII